MLATPERIAKHGHGPDETVWHKPADRHRCKGDCDFHAIACSPNEGIVVPAPDRDAPVALEEPHQRWCLDCLELIRKK